MIQEYRKRFGQHFLKDEEVIQKIIRAVSFSKNDIVIEIGPGTGVITEHLIKKLRHLYAIEIDRDIVKKLHQKFTKDQLTLYEKNVLEFNFLSIEGTKKIIGNLPYNISTPLLFYLKKFIHQIEVMYFMIQKEVADRLTAKPFSSNYGSLSVLMQYDFEITQLFNVKPDSFFPKPKVQSAFIKMTPNLNPFPKVRNKVFFEKIVKTAFNQRRKTVNNSLKSLFEKEILKKADIDPKSRAEELSIKNFIKLANSKLSTDSSV